MQIMKLLPTVCAVGICASFISVRADDTPVQAAARAALEQKMSEIDTNQTQPAPGCGHSCRRRKSATKQARNQNCPGQGNNSGSQGNDSGGHDNNERANPDTRCTRCASCDDANGD